MVNWTADKDQIILKGIFKFHDVKSSAPLLEYLAKEIGGDCTPKAVSHRLTNIRKGGTARANTGGVSPSPKSTPRPRAKATPRKSKQVLEEVDSDEMLSPTAARDKRGKSGGAKRKVDYKESDAEDEDEDEDEYVPIAKRVKAEPVEEDEVFTEGLVEEEV